MSRNIDRLDYTFENKLFAACDKIASKVNRELVYNLIAAGADNAVSTMQENREYPDSEYVGYVKGSIESILAIDYEGKYNRHVVAFFAKRGISA